MGDGDGGIGLSKKDLMDLLFTCIRSGDSSSVRASARILLKRYPDDAETLFFTGMFSFGLDPEEGMVYWERLASSMHNLEGPEAQRILDLIYPQMVEVISNYYVQGNFESYSGLMSMGKDLAPYGRALVQDVIEAVPSGIHRHSQLRPSRFQTQEACNSMSVPRLPRLFARYPQKSIGFRGSACLHREYARWKELFCGILVSRMLQFPLRRMGEHRAHLRRDRQPGMGFPVGLLAGAAFR